MLQKIIFLLVVSVFVFSCGEDVNDNSSDTKTECSKENLQGTCPENQTCIDGECKAECSKENQNGYCPENETCVEGECKTECSKENLQGICPENQTCIDGECKAECSKENQNGHCPENQTCIEGECKINLKGIKIEVTEEKSGNVLSTVTTDENGNFTIEQDKLQGDTVISILKSDKFTNEKFVINYSQILLDREIMDINTNIEKTFINNLSENVKLLKISNKAQFNLRISGKISLYECIREKDMGEPVPGAEIFVEQEPADEPLSVTKTDEKGNFCFGSNCSGVKFLIKKEKVNGQKAGFAVGGYRRDKVNGQKAGFAVGGYRRDKADNKDGYKIILDGDSLTVFTPILITDSEKGFSINNFEIESSEEEPKTHNLNIESSLSSWDYSCKE